MAHALAASQARDPHSRARRLRAAGEPRTGTRKRCGSTCAIATNERWLDGAAADEFRPYTHYGVGGNTKFWGSVLYRLRREDFQAIEHLDGVSPAWPIDYDTLEPYYDRAERLYHVHGRHGVRSDRAAARPLSVPARSARRRDGGDRRAAAASGTSSVAAAARADSARRPGGCVLCNTCNSFPCQIHAKSDADVCGIRPALERRTSTLWTNARARAAADRSGGTEGRGRRGRARRRDASGSARSLFVVSCGAVNSAALLLRSANDAHPNGLANSSGLVGRRYMAHLATMMQGFHPLRKNETVFQKTVGDQRLLSAGPRTTYPLGQIQSQGRTHGVMAQTRGCRWIPLWAYECLGGARRRLAGDVRGSAARRTTA